MRIFIAFPVAPAIIEIAEEWQKLIQKKYPFLKAKWVSPSNLHVTIEFLGIITEVQLQKVREILIYQTNKVRPFLYETIGSLTVFPNAHHAHTLVSEVSEKQTLSGLHLHNVVHEELSLFGITKDFKMWRPHLTLARTNGGIDIQILQTIILEKKEWLVDKVQLIEGTTDTNGSRYTILEEYPLRYIQ